MNQNWEAVHHQHELRLAGLSQRLNLFMDLTYTTFAESTEV